MEIARKDEFRKTLVREGATIGANATIVCGNTLGRFSFIDAGAVVTQDIPDYALIYGNPGKIHGWMCECGVKLSFSTSSPEEVESGECSACRKHFVEQVCDGASLEMFTWVIDEFIAVSRPHVTFANDIKTQGLSGEMFTIEQFLFGEHAIIALESTPYPRQATGRVQVFQNTSRLVAQARGFTLTISTVGRA